MADLTNGEVSYAALSRIEMGTRYPTLRTLEALAQAMGAAFTVTAEGTRMRLEL